MVRGTGGLLFWTFALGALFDAHILELARLEDFTAFEALYKLGLFVAADDLHAWMLARLFASVLRLRERL